MHRLFKTIFVSYHYSSIMFDEQKSLYAKSISPFLQAGVVVIAIILFNGLSWIISLIDIMPIKQGAPWVITTSFILCFALVNSVLSISSKSQNRYWLHSILSYVCLLIVGGGIAWLVSGLSIDQAGSYRWILLVFTMGYILFLSIVRAMKKIVTIAQKQDKRLRGEE